MKKAKRLFSIFISIFLLCACEKENTTTATESSIENESNELKESIQDDPTLLPEKTETSEMFDETNVSDFSDPLCILVVIPEEIKITENSTTISKKFTDDNLAEEIRDKLQSLSVHLDEEGLDKPEFENCLYEMIFFWNGMAVEYLYFSEDKILLNFTADDGYSRYELYSWINNEAFLEYVSELIQ